VAAFVAVLLATPTAFADPVTDFEMPFPCGQTWLGTTRDGHSPSRWSIDWNRADDVDDPVVASAAGKVIVADSVADSGYGRWVMLEHLDGERSLYAHMNSVSVSSGQFVDQGEQIGTLGSTGNSTGPHLHYEQRDGSTVVAPFFHQVAYVFGTWATSQNCVDVPMAADWNGDGIGQLTVFRRKALGRFVIYRPGRKNRVIKFGLGSDDPVLGDWDGNGAANPGVRTPSTRTFRLRANGVEQTIVFGWAADKPVAGNWDGVGPWEIGVWRARRAKFLLRAADGTVSRVSLGGKDDLPVTGDWNADGRTDLGVFDRATATFTLRMVDEEGTAWTASVQFGKAGDLPVTGDWDGNGRTDLGVWTPTTGVFSQRIAASPTSTMRRADAIRFGRPRI
jgi:hypothetical protein